MWVNDEGDSRAGLRPREGNWEDHHSWGVMSEPKFWTFHQTKVLGTAARSHRVADGKITKMIIEIVANSVNCLIECSRVSVSISVHSKCSFEKNAPLKNGSVTQKILTALSLIYTLNVKWLFNLLGLLIDGLITWIVCSLWLRGWTSSWSLTKWGRQCEDDEIVQREPFRHLFW